MITSYKLLALQQYMLKQRIYEVNINFRVKEEKFQGKKIVIEYQVPPSTQKNLKQTNNPRKQT